MFTRSPFPGMDPWLEPSWRSVHPPYIAHLYRQLAEQLPDDLFARLESDVYVVAGDVTGQAYSPDVAAFAIGDDGGRSRQTSSTALAVAEPVSVRFATRTRATSRLAVREAKTGGRLVTAIEVLSPTNKGRARDQAAYRDKRDDYLAASANVVEIDLLRAGADLMDIAEADHASVGDATYRACVRFADPDLSGRGELYPIGLRTRLPRIRAPLRGGDPDAILDLQSAIEDVYRTGRFDLEVDYAKPVTPPLSPADAAWAAQRVAAADGQA